LLLAVPEKHCGYTGSTAQAGPCLLSLSRCSIHLLLCSLHHAVPCCMLRNVSNIALLAPISNLQSQPPNLSTPCN
jgi:hypothetical protein